MPKYDVQNLMSNDKAALLVGKTGGGIDIDFFQHRIDSGNSDVLVLANFRHFDDIEASNQRAYQGIGVDEPGFGVLRRVSGKSHAPQIFFASASHIDCACHGVAQTLTEL